MRRTPFLAAALQSILLSSILLTGFPGAGAQTPSPDYLLTDDPSDVSTPDVPVGAMPPSPRSDPLDILELTIREPSEASFQFDIKTSHPWGGESTVSDTFTGYDFILDFQPSGMREPVRILVHGWAGVDNPDAVRIFYVRLCASLTMFCAPDGDLAYTTGDVLSITLPKYYLTHETPLKAASARAWPDTIERDSQLTNLYLRAVYGQKFTTGLGPGEAAIADRAPDDGYAPPYTVRRGLGVRDLTLVPGSTIISSDGQTSIDVAVKNGATHRRLIHLTATALPDDGQEPWAVDVTPSMDLAAGEIANATLRLEPRGGDPNQLRSQRIRVNATSVHEGGIGTILEERFGAAPGLVKGVNRVFIHALPAPPSPFSGLPFVATGPSFLSRNEKDPAADDSQTVAMFSQLSLLGTANPIVVKREAVSATQVAGRWYDAFPGRAHVGSTPVKAHLEFQTDGASNGPLTVYVFDDQRILLASGTADASFESGRNPVELDLLWAPDATMIGGPVPHIEVLVNYQPEAPSNMAVWAGAFALVPGVSYFDITVDELERSAGWLGGPRVTLSPGDARDAFVNPGRVTVFNVDLRNEDAADQTVEVSLRNKSADWNIEIRPATRFAIEPQKSVRLGIIVTAPAAATEGSRLLFELVAQRPDEGLDLSVVAFMVVSTSGVDIENETFAAAAGDADFGQKSGKGTPGVAWVGVTVVFGAVAFGRRKRRGA